MQENITTTANELTDEQKKQISIVLEVDPFGQGDQSCRCPIHSDRRNSASINFTKKLFNCFAGCGGRNFTQLYASIFGEEEKLDDNAELEPEQRAKAISEIKSLRGLDIAQPVVGVDTSYLVGEVELMEKAKAFLELRGISGETYAKVGAVIDTDVLSNTYQYIVFPNGEGSVGRRFVDGEPRYLNSHGDKHLYNYSNLSRDKDIILVEGIYDCLSLFEIGYENSCASLGTGFNEQQAYRFRGSTVFILFDRDYAGFTGAIKAKDHLEKMGANAIIFELPEHFGKDVNEGLVKDREGLKAWLKEKVSQYDSTDESYLTKVIAGNENLKCYSTGITGLDNIMAGGVVEGCHAIVGMPKTGKTSLGLFLAKQFAFSGNARVLYCTYEISKRQCWARLVSASLTRPWREIERDFKVEYQPDFKTLCKQIKVVAGWNISEIERASRHFDIIFVDYIQRMPGKGDDENARVGHNIAKLSDMARDHGKVIVVFSSIARDKYNKSGTVGLGKHSGDIEYVVQSQSLLRLGGDFSILEVQENTRGSSGSVYLQANLATGTFTEIETPPYLQSQEVTIQEGAQAAIA